MTENVLKYKVTFGQSTAPFVAARFPQNDLLPIVPFDAPLAKGTTVAPEMRGKVPGMFSRGQWWGLGGAWPTMGITDTQIKNAASWPTENVGLRAENWPAVDIDVASDEARELIEGIAAFHLGASPVRVRANAPRALCVFRRTGDEPIRKMRIVFRDADDVEHAVEVLGAGQQYLIAGRHPSGVMYEWRPNADLAQYTADGLTKVTAAEMRAFMDAVASEITGRGWTIITNSKLKQSVTSGGIAVADAEPIIDPQIALNALKAIPNNEETLPLREDFIGLLASFRAATGKASYAPEIEEEVRKWAEEYEWADENYFEGVWRSLTHVRVGPDKLFALAKRHGFHGAAAADFPDDNSVAEAEKIVEAVQTEEEEAQERLRAVCRRLVYWADKGVFILRDSGKQITAPILNAFPGLGTEIAPAGTRGTRAAANQLVNSNELQLVAGLTYLPGHPKLVTWNFGNDNAVYWNKWTPFEFPMPETVTDADVRPWLDHVCYLFENAEDREYLLDFLAHIVQHRGRKIRWSPIILGGQGIGKDLFLRPIIKGLGEQNSRTIQPEELLGQFIDFYEKELVIVEEIMRMEKGNIYEKMKAVISGTAADTVTIERKFEQSYDVPNVVNFVFFSNHSDALNLSEDDRRFFVIHSYARPQAADYYVELADKFYREQQGWRAVFAWLKQRDISAFNPDARPRFNEAKASMIEDSQTYYSLWLRDALAGGFLKHRSVLTAMEVLDIVQTDFGNVPDKVRKSLVHQNQVAKSLNFAGWHYRDQRVSINGRQQRVFVRSKELVDTSNEMLKARYEAEREKKVSSIA